MAALTIASVLGVGRIVAPLIGGAIRLVGKKESKAARAAAAVEGAINRNPKTMTSAIVVLVVGLAQWLCPEQAALVLNWLTLNGADLLSALIETASPAP